MLVRNAVGNGVSLAETEHLVIFVFVCDADSDGYSMLFETRRRGSQVSLDRESIVVGLRCGLIVMCRLVSDRSR